MSRHPILVVAFALGSVLASGVLLGLTGCSSHTGASSTRAVSAARPQVLPFIADDYSKALAMARAEQRPIFIESWAPW